MLKQYLQQKMLQKLSPQQLQFIRLLQIPTAMLDARIKEELEENPALEDISLMNNDRNHTDELFNDNDHDNIEEVIIEEAEDFSIDEYLNDDQEKEYGTALSYDSNDEKGLQAELPYAEPDGFYDYLFNQLSMTVLDDRDFLIARQIIGTLDDDGYLRRPLLSLADDISFAHSMEVSETEVENILHLIQTFEPSGIGARNLQECLFLQLKRKKTGNNILMAKNIVQNHLEEFQKKHYDKLEKQLSISPEALKGAIDEILKLNPKPGNAINDEFSKSWHIIPDFHITHNNDTLVLTLNSRNAPDLHVSKGYKEMFKTYEEQHQKDKKLKEVVSFVKQKLESAKWFIDAIKQRQQTLYKTMYEIMVFQREYFLSGDIHNLKPMILKDIAERISMDISTVSRIVNSKYVQTEFGTFSLKFFFSESIQTESGDEVSNREVKQLVEEFIKEENKRRPLSDERLRNILHQRGYNLARRTVAKYREQLSIPVARLRKKL